MRTTFTEENGELATDPKDSPNISGRLESENEQDVKYPKWLRHRGKGKVWATIYKRPDCYRLYWRARVDGKPRSMFKDSATYSEAKREGDKVVADLAKGSQAAALSPGQARDALAALERLQGFYVSTGRRVSLLAATSEFAEASAKLHGCSLGEAVEGYLSTIATVKRKDIAEAVEDFIAGEEPRTKATNGQRAQLSAKYAYNRAIMLRRFAGTFPGHAVCDLAKEHLDAFVGGLAVMKSKSRNGKPVISAKGRNHHRAAIRQFLQWAVRKDYLPATHRLGEADSMRPEHANNGEVQFYTPNELRALLEAAEGPMRAMVALSGLPLIASELVEVSELHGLEIPGKPADEDLAKRQVGTLAKQLFRDGDALDVDGFTIARAVRYKSRTEGGAVDVKTYTFTKPHQAHQAHQASLTP